MSALHTTNASFSTLTLTQIQQKISTISSDILSLSLSPSSSTANESFDLLSTPSSCDQCRDSNLQVHRICENTDSCLMKLCSNCLFQVFEQNGYHNTCPDCQQHLKFNIYQQILQSIPRTISQSSASMTPVEYEIQILMKDILSVICHQENEELIDETSSEKTFESIVKKWDKDFEVICECGESHRLYPESKKFVPGDLSSLVKMLRSICGASNERQLFLLEILQKLILKEVRRAFSFPFFPHL
jgi:hypothetical protein